MYGIEYEPNNKNNRKRCWYCYNIRNERKDTYHSCKTCKVPLCISKKFLIEIYSNKYEKLIFFLIKKDERDCFNKFHTKE